MTQPDRPDRRIGLMISEFAVPNIVAISTRIGYRFGILDCEHGAFDLREVSALAAAAAGQPFDLYVRIPVIAKEHIGPLLDAGVDGIIAPMVSAPQQAADIVRLATYPPLGERGISLTRAHSGYHVTDQVAYTAAANQRVKVYAQVETTEAVAAAAAIAAVPGLSGLIVGPNDLLQSLGTPGEHANPALGQALRTVAAACATAGIDSGVISGRAEVVAEGASLGMNFLSMDSDVGNLIRGGLSALDRFDALWKDS